MTLIPFVSTAEVNAYVALMVNKPGALMKVDDVKAPFSMEELAEAMPGASPLPECGCEFCAHLLSMGKKPLSFIDQEFPPDPYLPGEHKGKKGKHKSKYGHKSKSHGVKPYGTSIAALKSQNAAHYSGMGNEYDRVAREYGFTAIEVDAWFHANDAGATFEELAEVLASAPVPRTDKMSKERREQEKALCAKLNELAARKKAAAPKKPSGYAIPAYLIDAAFNSSPLLKGAAWKPKALPSSGDASAGLAHAVNLVEKLEAGKITLSKQTGDTDYFEIVDTSPSIVPIDASQLAFVLAPAWKQAQVSIILESTPKGYDDADVTAAMNAAYTAAIGVTPGALAAAVDKWLGYA